MTSRPNVLLVVFDTARADAFEPYGASRGSSPVVTDLARSGAVARNAFAPCNWTLPSHASLFTGMMPGALGLSTAARPGSSELLSRAALEARRDRVLPEVLRRAGYATAAISANPWILEVNGFGTGFERFVSVRGDRKAHGGSMRSKAAWTLDALAARADDGAAHAERLLREWVAARGQRPFFWFVNLMECHSPYLPPQPYNDLAALDRVRSAREAERYLTIGAMYRYSLRTSEIPHGALRRMRRLYAGAIRLMDAWLGRVLEMLDAASVLDDTVVVATADHGENLGENHLISHILSLDDRLLRVPLVARGVELPREEVTSLVDVPAMLAAAIGLRDHPWVERASGGVAVAQASSEMLLSLTRELAGAWGVTDDAIRSMGRTMTCATDGRLKLVRDEAGERVYEPGADREESSPLDTVALAREEGAVRRLRQAVDRVLADTVATPEPAAAPAVSPEEAAELEERMRQLGYM